MAYRIRHRDADATATTRRIACEQVEAALRSIEPHEADAASAIHDVRKRCKKIRGLLRLVRPAFDGYRAENAAFRGIAAPLGPLRDAGVRIATFDQIIATAGAGQAEALAPIRQQLCRSRDAIAATHDSGALLADALDALRAALPRIATWRVSRNGFAAFEDGLTACYRDGRRSMRTARKTGDDEAFHDWRKRCKDHTCHLRLLRPIWPGPMRAHHDCAAELGALLGRHHDLAVFARRVRDMPDLERRTVDALVARLHKAQHAIGQQAWAIGARLYSERPRALATSWRRRHAAWQRDPSVPSIPD